MTVKNPMNVLLITIDTLRADHLGCYGYPKHISPNINILANGGVQFNKCISQSSLTPTSHASILTGQNPYIHGVRALRGGKPYKLDRKHFTLATILKDAGYHTAAFVSAMMLEKEKFGLDRGFDLYEQSFYKKGADEFDQEKEMIDSRRRENPRQRRADLTTSLAIDWLNGVGEEPFFLWIHYFDPHETYLLPPEIPGFFMYSFDGPLTDIHPQLYDVEIRFVDLMIGNLISELSRLGIRENTLIILTSDHGQGLGDHNYRYHTHKLYQEQIHIPLIFSGKSIPSGLKINSLVRSVDITPTVLDILEYPEECVPSNFDGVSLRDLFEGQPDANRKELIAYSETSEPKARDDQSPLFSIVKNDFKLIYQVEAPNKSEMYNLADDISELNDIFSKEPMRAKELIRSIKQLQEATTVDLRHLRKGSHDKDWEEKLKALGYLK